MRFSLKYKRLGAFIIDLSIVQMFAQIVSDIFLGSFSYLGKELGLKLSVNDAMALPVILTFYISILLIFIGIYVGYHWVCFRYVGNSLSRYFLGLRVVTLDGNLPTKRIYLKREFEKAVLTIATIGAYPLYSAAQYFTHSKAPWHDNRNETKVVGL